MEKHIMSKIKEILEQEQEISNVKMYSNLEQSIVVSYEYENEKYLISQDIIEKVEE